MIKIQIYNKTKDLKSFVFIDFRKTREGVFDNLSLLAKRATSFPTQCYIQWEGEVGWFFPAAGTALNQLRTEELT